MGENFGWLKLIFFYDFWNIQDFIKKTNVSGNKIDSSWFIIFELRESQPQKPSTNSFKMMVIDENDH